MVVGVDVGALHLERPVLIAKVLGRFAMPGTLDQIDDVRVFSGGGDLPLPVEPPLTWKIVQALLADPHRLEKQRIVGRVQEDIVKGQVEVVVGVEISGLDGSDHSLVEGPHLSRPGFADARRGARQDIALESADDLVQMPNVIEGETTDLDSAPGEDGYEPLELELDQSITKRLAADSKLRGQSFLINEGPRLKIT